MGRRLATSLLVSCLIGLFACQRVEQGLGAGASEGFFLVQLSAGHRCGTGLETLPWLSAPRTLESSEVGQLALDSLAWYERRLEGLGTEGEFRLELRYRTNAGRVRAMYDPSLELSWEEQLLTWLEAYPYAGDGAPELEPDAFGWTLTYGAAGEIRGAARTSDEAIGGLKARCDATGAARLGEVRFGISTWKKRGSHRTDVFTAEAGSLEELETIEARLQEKIDLREAQQR